MLKLQKKFRQMVKNWLQIFRSKRHPATIDEISVSLSWQGLVIVVVVWTEIFLIVSNRPNADSSVSGWKSISS